MVPFIRQSCLEPREQHLHNLPADPQLASRISLATAGIPRLGFLLIRARKSFLTARHRKSPSELPHLRNRAQTPIQHTRQHLKDRQLGKVHLPTAADSSPTESGRLGSRRGTRRARPCSSPSAHFAASFYP